MRKKYKVAIVIPTHKSKFNQDDLISLKHLRQHLNKYNKYICLPKKVRPNSLNVKGFKFLHFPNYFFETWRGYNELLLNRSFYLPFKKYDYILIYQTDVLVFSDKLQYWCAKGYDFVAAPWFKPVIGLLSHKKGLPVSGGNGGFSLRKISSIFQVFDSVDQIIKRSTHNNIRQKLWFILALLTGKSHQLWLNAPADNYPFAEDGFWSLEAPKYIKGYKIPKFNEAIKFGFERFPRKCFELNNYKLPFGCHAWRKYDEQFWQPFILK